MPDLYIGETVGREIGRGAMLEKMKAVNNPLSASPTNALATLYRPTMEGIAVIAQIVRRHPELFPGRLAKTYI